MFSVAFFFSYPWSCAAVMTTMEHPKMKSKSDSVRRWSLWRTTWGMWFARASRSPTKRRTSSPSRSCARSKWPFGTNFAKRSLAYLPHLCVPLLGGEPRQEPDLFWLLQLQRPAEVDKDPAGHSGLCARQHHFPFQQDGEKGWEQRWTAWHGRSVTVGTRRSTSHVVLLLPGSNVMRSIHGMGELMSQVVLRGGGFLPTTSTSSSNGDTVKTQTEPEKQDILVMDTKLKIIEILQVRLSHSTQAFA